MAELAVAFQVQVSLPFAEWKDVSDLRPDAEDARLETSDPVAGATVAGDLLVSIADQPDEKLFRQELRGSPIEMEVDTILVLGVFVGEIVRESCDRGKLVPLGLVEVGVAESAVDRAMPNTDIGQAIGIV